MPPEILHFFLAGEVVSITQTSGYWKKDSRVESTTFLIMDCANCRKEDCSQAPVRQMKLQLFSKSENQTKGI